MNPQEKVQLEQFLQQLNSTQAGAKDSDANALIAESIKQQPDASYLLVQRAMGLEMALQVAQKQMAEMQAQIDQANQANKPSSGFLSGINSWGRASSSGRSAAKCLGLGHARRNCNDCGWCGGWLHAVPRHSEHDGSRRQCRRWYSVRPFEYAHGFRSASRSKPR
jgi:hypothetical protein